MIIFDEYSYALELEKSDITDSYNALKKGCILAKLYFSRGDTEEEIYHKLSDKFSILDAGRNCNVKHSKINIMIAMAKKNIELKQKNINFSLSELEKIKNLKNKNLESFTFVMLALFKFNDNKNFYINEREIFRLANISWSGNLFSSMVSQLHSIGYLNASVSKLMGIKNSKVMFCFTSEIVDEEKSVLEIEDYRNLVYYYFNFFDKSKFTKCEECNKIILKNSNRQRYCEDCRKFRKP